MRATEHGAVSRRGAAGHGGHGRLGPLALGALGVVYGDIGTSPLYAFRECFHGDHAIAATRGNVLGVLSLMAWALFIVVTIKYLVYVLRADNRGEGGELALMALALSSIKGKLGPKLVIVLGIFGASLLYGDGMITPAISVLSAVEGLEVAAPGLKRFVIPTTIGILIGLFMVQKRGTAGIGAVFGPIMLIWFTVLAVIGATHIIAHPGVLEALSPHHAVRFLAQNKLAGFLVLGAVFLVVTGGEALYADMGHFGRRPIQIAWTGLVLPSLALNYLGQGALLIGNPSAIENPFYRMFPDAWVLPALVLATLAAIIASQAVISGAYSMTRQAIQLGFLPRMAVRHTSAREAGQIYMPAVNWLLLAGVVAAVVLFGSSSALAGAYGIAVTLTMMITTVLAYFVVRDGWRLPAPVAIGATMFFLAIDAVLVAGCAVKFLDGGWFPLALGALLFGVMSTWSRGRALLLEGIRREGVDLREFLAQPDLRTMSRATRTAVYPVADPTTVPQALLHNIKHNEVLHEHNVIVTVVFRDVPWVAPDDRAEVERLGEGFWRVALNFGFMETPDVPRALALTDSHGLHVPAFSTSYFLSRETVVPLPRTAMATWRDRLFVAMSRNAGGVVEYFRLPGNAVVEIGTRVQI